jgi:hypothetical protein
MLAQNSAPGNGPNVHHPRTSLTVQLFDFFQAPIISAGPWPAQNSFELAVLSRELFTGLRARLALMSWRGTPCWSIAVSISFSVECALMLLADGPPRVITEGVNDPCLLTACR